MIGCRFYIALALLLSVSLVLTETKKAGQILDCIIRKVPADKQLEEICTMDQNLNDKACTKTVLGMKQCFIINDCYSKKNDEDMDVHCWNCWVDYTTDSHTISSYQDQFRTCNWSSNLTFASFLAFSLILSVLFA